jgi:hypothetical protein
MGNAVEWARLDGHSDQYEGGGGLPQMSHRTDLGWNGFRRPIAIWLTLRDTYAQAGECARATCYGYTSGVSVQDSPRSHIVRICGYLTD